MKKRKLELCRETLRSLDTEVLARPAGGLAFLSIFACKTRKCLPAPTDDPAQCWPEETEFTCPVQTHVTCDCVFF